MFGPVVVVGVGYPSHAETANRTFDMSPITDPATLPPPMSPEGWGALGGADAFLAFLRGPSSGVSVSNERETTVGGHRAVIVDMAGKVVPRPCWTNPDNGETNLVLQWTQHADPGWKWAGSIGFPPYPIVITEVTRHTLVFEDIEGANTLYQSVLDSVRFLDALPTPPTT